MKFIHLSDLHLGKKLHESSLIEDQEYILNEILQIIDEEKPDGVILAGDIYDKSIPPVDAVELFDSFLVSLSKRNINTFVISGNHDSPERVSCGGKLMEKSNVYMAPVYSGEVKPISFEDEYGKINVYLLPFVKPSHIRRFYPDEKIESYSDAMRVAVENMNVDSTVRNVLVTHQFVTGAELSTSEDIAVGGTDNIDGTIFKDFDYVALGHIHRPQNVGSERIRYCGTPLKYSFSEVKQEKSVTAVQLDEKGSLKVETIPLEPLYDMAELKGTFDEVTSSDYIGRKEHKNDYVHIILTDEEDVPNAMGRLRNYYNKLLWLSYDNKRTSQEQLVEADENADKKDPLDVFADFYEQRNNKPMTQEQTKYMKSLIDKIWGENR